MLYKETQMPLEHQERAGQFKIAVRRLAKLYEGKYSVEDFSASVSDSMLDYADLIATEIKELKKTDADLPFMQREIDALDAQGTRKTEIQIIVNTAQAKTLKQFVREANPLAHRFGGT